jgi:hypothetical protein
MNRAYVDLVWLHPWVPVGQNAGALVEELLKELSATHVLYGPRIEALAQRVDCDDVLFTTDNENGPLAVVHLTWSGRNETDPRWPITTFYEDIHDWIQKCMIPDHHEISSG